jgi:hypothetical protein
VNASAPVAREVEVQARIRKVSTFSRYARVVCSALFGFGLVGIVCATLFGVLRLIFQGPLTDSLGAIEPSASTKKSTRTRFSATRIS